MESFLDKMLHLRNTYYKIFPYKEYRIGEDKRMNVFGERLKSLRDKNKQSINELVLELNKKYETSISKSMISRYENGQSDPKMEIVRILADYFDVSSDYLVGISDMQVKPLKFKIHEDVETIAAHHDGEDWTEEELEEIRRFKEFVKSKRKNNQE